MADAHAQAPALRLYWLSQVASEWKRDLGAGISERVVVQLKGHRSSNLVLAPFVVREQSFVEFRRGNKNCLHELLTVHGTPQV